MNIKKSIKKTNFIFQIIFIILNIKNIILESCDYDTPLLKDNNCIKGPCTPTDYDENICTVNNEKVKTQWFNDIIPITEDYYVYLDIITMSNGELLIETSSYPLENRRIFYGIKKNGRPFFKESDTLKETSFHSMTTLTGRQESFIYNIKLNGPEDDKEYIISIPKDDIKYFELYDFYNDIVYEQSVRTTLKDLAVFSYRGSIIKLNAINNYILGISGIIYTETANVYFNLIKLSFNSTDFINNDPIIQIVRTSSSESRMVSCFETTSQNIVCFYQNKSLDYIIAVYDYNLENKIFFNLTVGSSVDSTFYKAIHFTGEAGAFGYFYNNYFYIQFKVYNETFNDFYNYFNSIPLIKIDKLGLLSMEIKLNDMIKISDTKICFVTYDEEQVENYFIIINNYYDEKIKIRYYKTNLFYLYNFRYPTELKLSLYNDNLIAMAISMKNDYNMNALSYLILLSYPNSTDFDVNVTETLQNSNGIFINPKEKCFIDNNLFGYIFYGIKIIDFNEEYELFTTNSHVQIHKDSILVDEEKIELILSEETNYPNNGRIEYAMILTEPSYSDYDNYSFIIDDSYSDENEQSYFIADKYIGKTSYINIIMDLEKVTKECDNDENCALCFEDEKRTCVICKYSFEIQNKQKKCLPITESTIIKTHAFSTQPNTSGASTTIPISSESNTVPISSEPIDFRSSLISQPNSITTKFSTEIEDFNTELTDISNKEKKCSEEEIINNKCNNGKININQLGEIKKALLNKDYIITKENKIIFTENIIIQLSTLEDQQNTNDIKVSSINFGECEGNIKRVNNISSTDQLIVYKMDIKSEDLSATYVLYELYSPYDLKNLDLLACKGDKISIYSPVILNGNIEILYDSLNKSGYNLFNESDSFYNDNCAKYTTDNGTDMLLSDRKNYFFSQVQNQYMCQKGCDLQTYNSAIKKANCSCEINSNTEDLTENHISKMFSIRVIEENFYKTLKNSNFRVLKCYKLLFNSDTSKNIGEIIMSILVIIFIGIMIVFFFTKAKKIDSFITSIFEIIKFKRNQKKEKTQKTKHKLFKKGNSQHIKEPTKKRKSYTVRSGNNNKEINDKNTVNERKKTFRNSKKFIQNNIFLNVNLYKSKKKTNKSHIYPLNRKQSKELRNVKKRNSAMSKNNVSSSIDFINQKEKIDVTPLKKELKYGNLSDYELYSLEYKKAIEVDKRTFFQYYRSLLKRNQLLLFTFSPSDDFNLTTIKISLFLISFSLYFCINGFFFSDSTMHKIYEDKGKYNFVFQLPQILYSSIVSATINTILRALALSEKNILVIKKEEKIKEAEIRAEKVKSCLNIKFLIFYIISFLMFAFFWYFISCFCAVYINTQYTLIEDTLISFFFSMIYPFGLNLLPGILRIWALRAKKKDKICLYQVSKIIALVV